MFISLILIGDLIGVWGGEFGDKFETIGLEEAEIYRAYGTRLAALFWVDVQ